jgi:hypothetical protein
MIATIRFPVVCVFVLSLILPPSSFLRADGGTLCLLERVGGYQVAIFTSPTPLRAGPVDVSILVQDASTRERVPGARVVVRLKRHGTTEPALEYEATTEAATNKLFHAAKFDLPESGHWDIEVRVDGSLGPARVRCEVEAAGPLPRWLEVWPWVGWPVLAILLFGVHQRLVRRRARSPVVASHG